MTGPCCRDDAMTDLQALAPTTTPTIVRLKRNQDFGRVFRRGRSARRGVLLVHVLRQRPRAENRVGVTVSRQVRTAVARNHLKRWLREAWRLVAAAVEPGWDIVLTATRRAEGANFQRICADLMAALDELGLWRTGQRPNGCVKP